MEIVNQLLSFFAYLFVFAAGLAVLAIVVLYIVDVTQTTHAIRRNYPVIGRFRYYFEELGEFFRQYFFAMDREEMPFNRAERSWVYRAAKGLDNTVAFGSTRDLGPVGTPVFVNCPWPTLDSLNLRRPSMAASGAASARSRVLLRAPTRPLAAISPQPGRLPLSRC